MTQHDDQFEQLLAEERIILQVTELIAEAIEHRGMTRKQLADALGVSQAEVTQRLSGRRNLTLRSVAAMLHALDAEVEVEIKYHGEAHSIPMVLAWPGPASVPTAAPAAGNNSIRWDRNWQDTERRSDFAIAG